MWTDRGEYRLQFSVWDHARIKHNTCSGGFSFSLAEIAAATEPIAGAFALLTYHEGRLTHPGGECGGARDPPRRSLTASLAGRNADAAVAEATAQNAVADGGSTKRRASRARRQLPTPGVAPTAAPVAAAPAPSAPADAEPLEPGDRPVPEFPVEEAEVGLRRSNSQESLASVASELVESVRATAPFAPPAPAS